MPVTQADNGSDVIAGLRRWLETTPPKNGVWRIKLTALGKRLTVEQASALLSQLRPRYAYKIHWNSRQVSIWLLHLLRTHRPIRPGFVVVYLPTGGRPVSITSRQIARRLVRDDEASWVWDRGEAYEGREVISQEAIILAPESQAAAHLLAKCPTPMPYTGGCGVRGL